jgi:hypothetical protein
MKRNSAWVAIVFMALCAQAALAQPRERTVVMFTAGVASGEAETGGVFGGTVVVNLNERVAVEGQGTYFDRGSGADAVNLGGSVVLNVVSSLARGGPYLAVGASVHHATFDLSEQRFLGMRPTPVGPGTFACTTPGERFACGQMPMFYARRLTEFDMSADGMQHRGFTDPAVTIGGGVRINLNDRWLLRPDVRALIVIADRETYNLAVFVVNLGYRF